MTAAVDSTVLFDLLLDGSSRKAEAAETLDRASSAHALILSETAYAEIANLFEDRSDLDRFLKETSIRLQRSNSTALFAAGQLWSLYASRRRAGLECANCGRLNRPDCTKCGTVLRSRQHMIADFMIGAHALEHADGVLTRDGGHLSTYFPNLVLLYPATVVP